jgi:septum formation topological specificity factor MinE
MDTSMFQLQPKLKEPLQIVFLLDNSYIFDTDALEDLKKQLEVIDRYVFQKEYRQYVHIDVLYFDGF